MEFSEDFIKDNNLTDEQVTAISGFATEHIADLKKGWDGLANTNAEKILSGAAAKVAEFTSVQREEGEKIADYYSRAWETYSSTETASLKKAKEDYEDKMKNIKGNETLSAEYEELKGKYSSLQQKEAEYDQLISSGLKEKYETASESLTELNLEVSFNSVKPNFPDSVNSYEASAKWNEFKNNTLKKYDVKLIDNEAICIDKENEHKTFKLKELLSKDTDISELLQGRQQKGPNANPTDMLRIKDVPFEVPANATSKDRQKLIRDYLAGQGIGVTHQDYSKKYAELNTKILKQETADA